MNPRIVETTNRVFIPRYLDRSEELCLLHHDVLVEMLRAGEEHGSFGQVFDFRDQADRDAFEAAADVFDWLERTRDRDEWGSFIRRSVFPALLSDFLHFVYEALCAARQAKLAVAYALLRKPLQDNLGLLEAIAVDPTGFVETFGTDPLRLRPMKAGGVNAHHTRIAKVLAMINEEDRFDPAYLAQLRYLKGSDDGFDGICNQALHLLTEHPAIRTDRLNINFVFSGDDARQTQWYFLYSRLPYILHYARLLFEHLLNNFCPTDSVYLADIERRTAAATLLWWPAVEETYKNERIARYIDATEARLASECEGAGARRPTPDDLLKMRDTGAFPGESALNTQRRNLRHALIRYSSRALAGATTLGHYVQSRLSTRMQRRPG